MIYDLPRKINRTTLLSGVTLNHAMVGRWRGASVTYTYTHTHIHTQVPFCYLLLLLPPPRGYRPRLRIVFAVATTCSCNHIIIHITARVTGTVLNDRRISERFLVPSGIYIDCPLPRHLLHHGGRCGCVAWPVYCGGTVSRWW